MALIACPDCQQTVSDQAPTCPHCGYPIRTTQSTPAEPARYETCQIEWASNGTMMGLPRNPYQFWAKAVSPLQGEYKAGESVKFNFAYSGVGEKWMISTGHMAADVRPRANDQRTSQAHSDLVQKLVGEGWEPSSLNGHEWWQLGFRRKVDDRLLLEEERTLYRDLQASNPIRALAPGGEVRILQSGDGGSGWAKVRTSEGEEGYLFIDESQAKLGMQERSTAAAAKSGCLLVLAAMLVAPVSLVWKKLTSISASR